MEKFEDHSLQYCQDLQTSIISSRIYICNNIYRIMYSYICINIDIISVFKLSECSSNLTFSPHVSGLKNRRRFLSSLSTLLAKLGFRVGIKFVKFQGGDQSCQVLGLGSNHFCSQVELRWQLIKKADSKTIDKASSRESVAGGLIKSLLFFSSSRWKRLRCRLLHSFATSLMSPDLNVYLQSLLTGK